MTNNTRDNILYLTIALAVVAVALLAFRYRVSSGQPSHPLISASVFAFFLTTTVVFGCLIQVWRKAWRRVRFWVAIGLLLAAYCPLQWILVQYLDRRLAMLTLIAGLE